MEFEIIHGKLRKYWEIPDVTEVRIPDGVTEIWTEAFSGCNGLTSVYIPDSVRWIEDYAFFCCPSLKTVRFPEQLIRVGRYAFYGCKRLKTVTLPDGLEIIDKCAFSDCTGLISVRIPESAAEIRVNAFEHTPWLEAQQKEFVMVGDQVLIHYNGNDTHVHVPEDVKYFDPSLFGHWDFVKYLTCKGITYERETEMENAFVHLFEIVEHKQYNELLSLDIKYPLLWQVFCARPEEAEIKAYVRDDFEDMFVFAVKNGLAEAVEAVCTNGTLLTPESIDGYIEMANQVGQHGIQLILMNYKKEVFGFDETERFRL